MNKYSKVYIGILNEKNLVKVEPLQIVARTSVVLLSNLNFFELPKKQLEIIKNKNIILIPSNDNIKKANKHKKSTTYTLFIDWLLRLPTEVKFVMDNDSLLYVSHKDENWHNQYDGSFGFGVSTHKGEDTVFHGHSASLPNNSDKLLLKEFNGFFLENTQS